MENTFRIKLFNLPQEISESRLKDCIFRFNGTLAGDEPLEEVEQEQSQQDNSKDNSFGFSVALRTQANNGAQSNGLYSHAFSFDKENKKYFNMMATLVALDAVSDFVGDLLSSSYFYDGLLHLSSAIVTPLILPIAAKVFLKNLYQMVTAFYKIIKGEGDEQALKKEKLKFLQAIVMTGVSSLTLIKYISALASTGAAAAPAALAFAPYLGLAIAGLFLSYHGLLFLYNHSTAFKSFIDNCANELSNLWSEVKNLFGKSSNLRTDNNQNQAQINNLNLDENPTEKKQKPDLDLVDEKSLKDYIIRYIEENAHSKADVRNNLLQKMQSFFNGLTSIAKASARSGAGVTTLGLLFVRHLNLGNRNLMMTDEIMTHIVHVMIYYAVKNNQLPGQTVDSTLSDNELWEKIQNITVEINEIEAIESGVTKNLESSDQALSNKDTADLELSRLRSDNDPTAEHSDSIKTAGLSIRPQTPGAFGLFPPAGKVEDQIPNYAQVEPRVSVP